MDYRILGEFEVCRDGRPVDLGAPKARAVLAVLLLNRDAVAPTERIIDAIWGDDPPRTAAHSIQTYVSGLRKALGGEGTSIETRTSGYRLDVDPESIDACRFERLAAEGASELGSGAIESAIDKLREALDLWLGTPLPDFAYAEFAQSEIRRLEEIHIAAVDDLAEAFVRHGEPQQALQLAEWAVDAQPLRERSRAILMHALAVTGRQAEALREYSSYRQHLGDELGIAPSEELRRLEERILLQDPALLATDIGEKNPIGNLPLETTSFVGRQEDAERVRRLLIGSRLVTLLGVGGVGKSRLALHVAHELADGFDDGVWRVDFLGLTDPGHVPAITAATLESGWSNHEEATSGLIGLLKDKEMLILLDNCESVAGGAAMLAEALLHAAPSVKIMATSREPLEVQGEVLWRVHPLASPDPGSGPVVAEDLLQYDSVQLFCQRAGAADPTFYLGDEDADHLAHICRLLDGIPLAVELAAARVRHMTLAEIDTGLDDRFALLVGGSRTTPRRYRALDATIDWSYRHLDRVEQEFFKRLGVFMLEFPLEAAELVCSGDGIDAGEVRDLLGRLTDKSLVMRKVRDGRTRYRLLDTLAEYLYHKVGDRGRFHHVGFFMMIAQLTDPALRGPEEQMWATLLGGEPDVTREVLSFAASWFREDEGAYLAGVAAALMTRTGRVGFVAGLNPQLPRSLESGNPESDVARQCMSRCRNGYVSGATQTEPAVTVDEVYLTDDLDVRTAFRSPALGREVATDLYSRGCDVVFHAAGMSGDRIFEAARRMSEDTGLHRWGIGIDTDEYLSHEDSLRPHVLASVLKQVPIDVFSVIKEGVISGRAHEAPHFDLGNQGVRLATSGGALDHHSDALALLQRRIIEGDIDTGWKDPVSR